MKVASPVRPTGVPHGGTSSGIQADAWEKLLTDAGLEERDARPLPGGALTPTQATRLLSVLLGKSVTLGTFPARMAVGHLLREVLADGEVSRDTLLRRVDRFRRVAVLRPDGHLAWVWTGRTQQKAGALKWKDGTFRAGPFELGRFYVSNGFVIELADAQLAPVHGPVFVEVYDDADFISRTLDGAEAAFVKLALALGQFLTSPRDSIAALKDLPAGVVALIASSPEYFERFRYMTRGEQVQAVAELTTSLLVTKGTATAATRTVTGALAGAEATVPVLSLSAQGALTLERVAVPVGRAASALSGGPGAAILLQRANTATPPAGPGKWGPAEESMSARARRYQEQISEHPADEAYWVGGVGKNSGGVKFDGFRDGVLLEAKGPGYARFFEELDPKGWFSHSGARALVEQARRQSEKVRNLGVPIQWHVAEQQAADAIRTLLMRNRINGVQVVYTPAL
ncbi:Tox-REase-5 domain-containing protein [Corallococcus soli]|nr:Tox-REase-5 domain-containing protein [Corallococcus soli]